MDPAPQSPLTSSPTTRNTGKGTAIGAGVGLLVGVIIAVACFAIGLLPLALFAVAGGDGSNGSAWLGWTAGGFFLAGLVGFVVATGIGAFLGRVSSS
jgi:hypothetical protein